MKNLWDEREAEKLNGDLLKLRVYTSRLLGAEEDLVLHGGGNTSVKAKEVDIFGEEQDILYVKGSGWNLGTIEAEGFAPVKLQSLLRLAKLEKLSDTDMVKYQRMAMINPAAPNPSVEAILHAIIPFRFVDHTHADAVVTITNTANGLERIEALYGNRMLVVPYVMPGFILARKIYELTQDVDWTRLDGMILMNHGVFTFDDEAKASYDKMISIVSKAEKYLEKLGAVDISGEKEGLINTIELAKLRKEVSTQLCKPSLARLHNSGDRLAFSNLHNVNELVNRGPLTPDHIIRTKRVPLVLSGNHNKDLADYTKAYQIYFESFTDGKLQQIEPSPKWAIWPKSGTLSFGVSPKHLKIIEDISRHTMKAIYQAEKLGGWQTLEQADLFEMEYWVLEQEKLKKVGKPKAMQGKIALVTGAASGIGKASVERLVAEGAVVAALDIDPSISSSFEQVEVLGLECDIRSKEQVNKAVEKTVAHFGGLDLLVTNAGVFPESREIGEMDKATWDSSLDINLSSHQQLLQIALPYLELGIEPSVVIIGSKNVPAPGPGAAAYSVAKAGLTQLGRIAALELGKKGIRVNILHPNAVYDTGIWTEEVLAARAKHYNLSIEDYKTNNLLGVEVTSQDVAELVVLMLGNSFSKITGVQLPVDGGNLRVI